MPTNFAALFAEGYRARRDGDSAHSRAIFLHGVRHASEERNEAALAEALCGLAQAERDIGAPAAAIHQYANAVLLYRRVGPPERLAYALRHQADLLREAAKRAEAEPIYREAGPLYRETEALYREAGGHLPRGWRRCAGRPHPRSRQHSPGPRPAALRRT